MGTYLLMCDEWEQCIVVSAYLPHNFCGQYLFFHPFTCVHLYCYSWTMSLRQLLIIIDLNFHLCIGMQGICYYDWSELKQSKGNKDLAVITTLWWHCFVLFLFYMVGDTAPIEYNRVEDNTDMPLQSNDMTARFYQLTATLFAVDSMLSSYGKYTMSSSSQGTTHHRRSIS